MEYHKWCYIFEKSRNSKRSYNSKSITCTYHDFHQVSLVDYGKTEIQVWGNPVFRKKIKKFTSKHHEINVSITCFQTKTNYNSISDIVNFLFWNLQNTKYIFISLLCCVVNGNRNHLLFFFFYLDVLLWTKDWHYHSHLQTTTYSVLIKPHYFTEILFWFFYCHDSLSKENIKVCISLKVSLNVKHTHIIEIRFNKFFTIIISVYN